MIERTEAPLQDWPNSDLLLDDAERAQFAVDHPLLHRIFDFEELRTTFKTHDEACKKLKTATHSEGIYTLIIGAVGVVLLGVSGLVPHELLSSVMEVIALIIAVGAGFWGMVQKFRHGDVRRRWLNLRSRLERTRQFHFQYILHNWDKAVEAMTDDQKYTEYVSDRLAAFNEVNGRLEGTAKLARKLIDDVHQEEQWLLKDWAEPSATPARSPNSDLLAQAFHELRIKIQLRYSRLNLDTDKNSVGANAAALETGASLCFAITPVFALLTLGALVSGAYPAVPFSILMLVSGTLALLFQALQLGLRVTEDRDRYEIYNAQLENLSKNYSSPDLAAKFVLLRQLEAFAYDELRSFLKSHSTARFSM